ncbi:hypothetical protein HK099_002241, partial [Clydaea vesicula]
AHIFMPWTTRIPMKVALWISTVMMMGVGFVFLGLVVFYPQLKATLAPGFKTIFQPYKFVTALIFALINLVTDIAMFKTFSNLENTLIKASGGKQKKDFRKYKRILVLNMALTVAEELIRILAIMGYFLIIDQYLGQVSLSITILNLTTLGVALNPDTEKDGKTLQATSSLQSKP